MEVLDDESDLIEQPVLIRSVWMEIIEPLLVLGHIAGFVLLMIDGIAKLAICVELSSIAFVLIWRWESKRYDKKIEINDLGQWSFVVTMSLIGACYWMAFLLVELLGLTNSIQFYFEQEISLLRKEIYFLFGLCQAFFTVKVLFLIKT